MVMWQDLNGGRCSMGDACSNPSDADGVYKMLLKNFERHFSTNRYVLRTDHTDILRPTAIGNGPQGYFTTNKHCKPTTMTF